jgi:cytochrome c oxidase cbb3-type subunit I/II
MRSIGVPYEGGYEERANEDLDKQAATLSESLQKEGIEVAPEAEIIALIAYLQRLGKDIQAGKTAKE